MNSINIDGAVCAELIGSSTASAEGISALGNSPILKLCRLLIAADIDPGRPLHAYRHNMLCLTVRSIGEGAWLAVDESRTTFARWKAFPHAAVSSGIAPFQRAATTPPVKPPIAPMPATAVAINGRGRHER